METYINRININTNKKIDKDYTILLISDIHLTKDLGEENLFKIKETINQEYNNIDYIVIVGDIINDRRYLYDEYMRDRIKNILNKLINNKKTFIVLGNHDLLHSKEESIGYYKEIIEDMNNVYLLNTGDIVIDNMFSFMGITPNYQFYRYKREKAKEYKKIIEEECKNNFKKETFNIILTHPPRPIAKLFKKNKIIANTDLILTGHMHNGAAPLFINKLLHGRGILSPRKTLFPKYSYGNYIINKTNIIVNGPINAHINNILINDLYKPKATIITVTKTYM